MFTVQPPPGLGGVQQSVQFLPWRNANCGGNYTGEVDINTINAISAIITITIIIVII